MNRRFAEQLASWNGYLALAGGLALLGGLVAFLVRGRRFPGAEIALGIGVALLVAAWLVNPAAVRRLLTARSTRYGSIVLLMAVAVIGIMVALNVLSYRHYRRWDLTEEHLHSLSPQTQQVLAELDRPVQVTGFFYRSQSDQQAEARYMLENYASYTPLFSYRLVDPEVSRVLAQQYGVSGDAYVLVFESGDQRYNVYSLEEADWTGAILRVTSARQVTVYFVTGHGEGDIESTQRDGYAGIRSLLEEANYRVETLVLAGYTGTLPVSDTVIVLLGPQKALSTDEEHLLAAYLGRGGKLFALLDPAPSADVNNILRLWGIYAQDDLIIDPLNAVAGSDPATPVADKVQQNHAITRNVSRPFFPGARSLEATNTMLPGLDVTPLLGTSDEAWGETDLSHQPLTFDAGQDYRGPLVLAAAVQGRVQGSNQTTDTRIVLVGDSDFVRNWAATADNQRFFLNAINWLAEEERLIDLAPVQYQAREVVLSGVQSRAIRYLTLVGIPLGIVLAGVAVWLQRRKR